MRAQSSFAQGVVALAAVSPALVSAQNDTAIAANLERYWSYGRSPAVYPTPQMSGSGGWAEAYEFARNLVSQMTNDEKNNITYGYYLILTPTSIKLMWTQLRINDQWLLWEHSSCGTTWFQGTLSF
jgi:hypothetical protein